MLHFFVEAAAEMHDEGSFSLDDLGDDASQVLLDEVLCKGYRL